MADSRVKDLVLLTSIDSALDSFLVEDQNVDETKRTTLDYIKPALGLTGTNSGDQNLFASIAVSGQSTINAGITTDTLTFVAGSNITITTNTGSKSVTINSTAAGVVDGDKGDITVSGSGATWTIDAGAVTYSKIQNVSATSRILGRKTAGAGVIEELTAGEILDFISTTQGTILIRTSTGWAALSPGTAGEFLRTNGAGANPSWATPTASISWGAITGTLSAQTDLQTALDAKITAFADPNADRIVFWDDSAGAFAALTASTELTISGTNMTVRSASESLTGIVELATDAETQAGSDTTRAVTPAGLASVGYITASSSATLTNKTFDANGTGNSISNLEVADFAPAAIVTASETIGANNNDTTIPTSAAVKAYADSVAGAGLSDGDKGDITVSSSGTVWTIDNDAVTYAKIQNVSAASRLLGRGSAAGSGDVQEITIGSGLSLSGTELSATGGGGGATNLWIAASQMIPRSTNGAGIDSRELATNRTNYDELLFDAGADEFAQFLVIMPNNYANGTVTARFYWTASTGSGNVVWGLQGRAFADDDALDTAFGTAQTVTDTLIATNDMHVTSATSAITIGGTPAANRPILFQVYRDADAGTDTFTADARLLGVEILF